MKAITIAGGAAGIILAVLAYFTELHEWLNVAASRTMGFVGYVLIITVVAYFLLSWLYKGDKQMETL